MAVTTRQVTGYRGNKEAPRGYSLALKKSLRRKLVLRNEKRAVSPLLLNRKEKKNKLRHTKRRGITI